MIDDWLTMPSRRTIDEEETWTLTLSSLPCFPKAFKIRSWPKLPKTNCPRLERQVSRRTWMTRRKEKRPRSTKASQSLTSFQVSQNFPLLAFWMKIVSNTRSVSFHRNHHYVCWHCWVRLFGMLATSTFFIVFLSNTVHCVTISFTAWSSTREPTAVFTLLETIYHEFDYIAKRRRVSQSPVLDNAKLGGDSQFFILCPQMEHRP